MLKEEVNKNIFFHKLKYDNLSLILKKYYKYFFTKVNKKSFIKIENGNLIVKLAETNAEIKKAQSLRYSVFYKEKNAKAGLSKKFLRRDFDRVDRFADHLIVIDKNRRSLQNNIIGTYRLIRGDLANQYGGFYTSTEFDLSNIFHSYKNRQILELGRSCVHKKYRNGATVNLLWKAIANYVSIYDIKILLGCASFPGTNVMNFLDELAYLKRNHSLQSELSVRSLDVNIYPINNSKNNNISDLKLFIKLPPLIKGYLRVGGKVSESYFVDHDFNTIDLCLVVQTNDINNKYKKKFYTS
jgi:putative hemolysin